MAAMAQQVAPPVPPKGPNDLPSPTIRHPRSPSTGSANSWTRNDDLARHASATTRKPVGGYNGGQRTSGEQERRLSPANPTNGASLPASTSHSRRTSRDAETPEGDRARNSDTNLPVTKNIVYRQRLVENDSQRRTSHTAEISSNDGEDDYYEEQGQYSNEPSPGLQYFHRPFPDGSKPPSASMRHRMQSPSSSSISSGRDSSGNSANGGVPSTTVTRPASAYMLNVDGRGRHSHSLSASHLSVNDAVNHGRSVSGNRRSPDVRPSSYVDLLNVPYSQQVAPQGNFDNSSLKSVVGSNASLLDSKKTIEMYRANIKKMQDPMTLYSFALYMVDYAKELLAQDPNSTEGAEILKEVRTILQRCADKSLPFAQYYLADGYASGLFNKGKEDWSTAFPLFIAASKHGHAESAYRAALCYEFGWGCRKDYAKAAQFYRSSASRAHPGAATRLGKACLTGEMGLVDRYREGLKWLKRAAEYADFQYNNGPYELGMLHEHGFGPDCFKDEGYAAQLFTQAAELGHAEASLKMGEAYEHGQLSCPKDPALSVHFYNGAAQAGIPEAMMNLCAWYMVGAEPVLEKDENEAYEWAKRAAEMGLPKAEYACGYFTEMGIGCRRDPLEANVWYVRAADQGEDRAKQRLAMIRAAATGDSAASQSPSDGTKKKKKGWFK